MLNITQMFQEVYFMVTFIGKELLHRSPAPLSCTALLLVSLKFTIIFYNPLFPISLI